MNAKSTFLPVFEEVLRYVIKLYLSLISRTSSSFTLIALIKSALPPTNIISLAEERQIPLLLVSLDTFKTAKLIDDMEVVLTVDDTDKRQLLHKLVKDNVDTGSLLG